MKSDTCFKPYYGPTLLIITLCILLSPLSLAKEVRFDFETGDLQGWVITEGSFGKIVSDRPTYHNFPDRAYNKQGACYLSTVEGPNGESMDSYTGVLESPVFVLTKPEVSFLVGGGNHDNTYVALCTRAGREVLRANGRNIEQMHRIAWDARKLLGQPLFLRIVDHNPGSWGYVGFDDFVAHGRIDKKATQQRNSSRDQERIRKQRRTIVQSFEPLQLAIRDLVETFGVAYSGDHEFQNRLDRIVRKIEGADRAKLDALQDEFKALQREALTSNPLLTRQPIAFVVRKQYDSKYHAIDTLFHTGEFNVDFQRPHWEHFRGGGALKVIDFSDGGKVTPLLESAEGVIRDPDIHFDGKRMVFAMRNNKNEDYHVYEMNTDGSGLKQLTSAEGVSDFDPFYMPDDRICFSSTREPKYNMCSRDHAANLFLMEGDGANIHQITKNTLFDNHGDLLPDGRILYARWEYVDRNFGDAHGLWTVNPDGTNQAIYWGNNTSRPGAVFNAHLIPGTSQVLCVLGMHHFRLWGAMAIIDRSLAIDGRSAVVKTWPPEAIDMVDADAPFDCDSFTHVYPKYEDPWPLSEKYFLCTRMTMRQGQRGSRPDDKFGESTGIYLVDMFGNEILLHTEEPGCYDPMPLRPRRRPPVIPPRRDFRSEEGYVYVADVYQGTHMEGVERGSVKRLRVVESPEKRYWSPGSWNGQGYTAPGMNWHSLENKRILGSVPVEADGSAHFIVPADKFIFFQLLDETGMMVQSMRSGTVLQPGERVGCVGCHDNRLAAAAPYSGIAMNRAPSILETWQGKPREFSFMAEVQPVLNQHCVRCHDYGNRAGEKLNLAPDRTVTFNVAYQELWWKGYAKGIGAGPAPVQSPYSWGAHASPLMTALDAKQHRALKLSDEDKGRIITWLDLNAPYYPTYACAYPDNLTGRSPLNPEQIARLKELTGVPLDTLRTYTRNCGPQISFDRPEVSPCLAKFTDSDDPKYIEALNIIKAGQTMLKEKPRADMSGFQLAGEDLRREKKYQERLAIEKRNREAIRLGKRVYDHGS